VGDDANNHAPQPESDAGLLPERGNCEVYELEDITSQILH
jgi:hypothetical protein